MVAKLCIFSHSLLQINEVHRAPKTKNDNEGNVNNDQTIINTFRYILFV